MGCPSSIATTPTNEVIPLTIHSQCATAFLLPKLILNVYGVVPTILGSAGRDHQGADTAGGVIPEFRISRDVDVAFV